MPNENIPTPPIYQNPFMAPNDFSEVHSNIYQTDTAATPGPGHKKQHFTQDALILPPVGQVCKPEAGSTILKGYYGKPYNHSNEWKN